MGSFLDKQKIIIYLVAVFIILLITKIILDRITGDTPPDVIEINTAILNNKLEKTLSDFGIEDKWIVKKPIKKKVDSVMVVYKIFIPKDLPVHGIISELNLELENIPVQITSKEKKINKETTLKILYHDKLMLQAEFLVNDTVTRMQDSVGFILTDFNKLNKDERKELLSLPEQYAISIIPSSTSEQEITEIIDSGREYVILINDDMNEPKFRLRNDYTPARNKSSIKNIISSFPGAKRFLIDNNSDYYKSQLGLLLKEEFLKRKLRLIELSSYEILKDEVEDAAGWFKNVIEVRNETNKIIVLSVKDYIELLPSLAEQRKKGNKFIYPSRLDFNSD